MTGFFVSGLQVNDETDFNTNIVLNFGALINI